MNPLLKFWAVVVITALMPAFVTPAGFVPLAVLLALGIQWWARIRFLIEVDEI